MEKGPIRTEVIEKASFIRHKTSSLRMCAFRCSRTMLVCDNTRNECRLKVTSVSFV